MILSHSTHTFISYYYRNTHLGLILKLLKSPRAHIFNVHNLSPVAFRISLHVFRTLWKWSVVEPTLFRRGANCEISDHEMS